MEELGVGARLAHGSEPGPDPGEQRQERLLARRPNAGRGVEARQGALARGRGAAVGRTRVGELRLERGGVAAGVLDDPCRRGRRLFGGASAIRVRIGLDGLQ